MGKRTINCGDWHLGWGFGGDNKVGKLTYNRDGSFTWEGHSQGRHGAKWNYGAKLHFWLVDGEIDIIKQEGAVPCHSELIKTAEALIILNK